MKGLATQEETKALTIIKHALQDAQIGREIVLSMKAGKLNLNGKSYEASANHMA